MKIIVSIALALVGGSALVSTAAAAVPSVQALYEAAPAPPDRASASPAWLNSAGLQAVRDGLAQHRAAASSLMQPMSGASAVGLPPDYARAAADPAYAEALQKRLQAMTPEQQMQEAMRMARAGAGAGVQEVVRMQDDPAPVKAAVEAYHRRPPPQDLLAELSRTQQRIDAIQAAADQRSQTIRRGLLARRQCSDGEGGCPSTAAARHDRELMRQAREATVSECDRALLDIGREIDAYRRSRAAPLAAGDRDLSAAQYGALSHSDSHRQVLSAYYSELLNEVEMLLSLSQGTAEWAAARLGD